MADTKFVTKPDQNFRKLRQEMHVQMAIQMSWRDACLKHFQDLGATFGVNILEAELLSQNSHPDVQGAEMQFPLFVHETGNSISG